MQTFTLVKRLLLPYNADEGSQFIMTAEEKQALEKRQFPSKLVSPMGYIGYSFLYALPVIGLILCIVAAFSDDPTLRNRRNFARSILIGYLLTGCLAGVLYYTGYFTLLTTLLPG